jgi:hypothetical protein
MLGCAAAKLQPAGGLEYKRFIIRQPWLFTNSFEKIKSIYQEMIIN